MPILNSGWTVHRSKDGSPRFYDGNPLSLFSAMTLDNDKIAGLNVFALKPDGGDAAGARVGQRDFDPFGRMTASSGSASFSTGFTGLLNAVEGLETAVYRSYDADLGRWLRQDPIGPTDNVNMYAYVANRPVSFIDPAGLASCRPTYTLGRSPGIAIGVTKKPLSNWVLASSLSDTDLSDFGIPLGVLTCLWQRVVETTTTYRRINLSMWYCTEEIYAQSCSPNPKALANYWFEIRPFIEEYTQSKTFVEQDLTKPMAPGALLGDLSGLECLRKGPPRR